MGEKGNQMTDKSVTAAEDLQNKLSSLRDIHAKKMFGGHGVFSSGKMFALIDKNGGIYFKVDDTNLDLYQSSGSAKHGRMPYFKVPDKVLDDQDTLLEWANISIRIAQDS